MKRSTLAILVTIPLTASALVPSAAAVSRVTTGHAVTTHAVASIAKSTAAVRPSLLNKNSASIYFAPFSAKLTASGKKVLSKLARAKASGWDFTATGYVQRTRSHTNDMTLSLARGKAVEDFLSTAGVEGMIDVQAIGIYNLDPTSPKARVVTVSWEEAAPAPEPEPSAAPSTTPTPTPTPAATTCDVVFDPQGGEIADTSTRKITSGDSVLLPGILVPASGDFSGWYTNKFTGFGQNDTLTFVGFGGQKVTVACLGGSTVTFYAHYKAGSGSSSFIPGIDLCPLVPGVQTDTSLCQEETGTAGQLTLIFAGEVAHGRGTNWFFSNLGTRKGPNNVTFCETAHPANCAPFTNGTTPATMFKIDWHGTGTTLTVSGNACNVYLYKATSPSPGNPGDFRTRFLERATLGQATSSTWSAGEVLYWVNEPYGNCGSGDSD